MMNRKSYLQTKHWRIVISGLCVCAVQFAGTINDNVYIRASFLQKGTFVDTRDGQTYDPIYINNQVWMAENLNYQTKTTATDSSWCYNDADTNCVKYGRLYNWNAAKKACPAGWRLPDTADWLDLIATAGGRKTCGNKLKSQMGWESESGIGSTDEYGFSALPGGSRYYYNGSFKHVGYGGSWWSVTEKGSGGAYSLGMSFCYNHVFENCDNKKYGLSVRCVKDRVR